MTAPETIQLALEKGLPESKVNVEGDGHHFDAVIISPAFQNQSTLNRQRMVNSILKEAFDSGTLHALSMKTFTPEEWQAANG